MRATWVTFDEHEGLQPDRAKSLPDRSSSLKRDGSYARSRSFTTFSQYPFWKQCRVTNPLGIETILQSLWTFHLPFPADIPPCSIEREALGSELQAAGDRPSGCITDRSNQTLFSSHPSHPLYTSTPNENHFIQRSAHFFCRKDSMHSRNKRKWVRK